MHVPAPCRAQICSHPPSPSLLPSLLSCPSCHQWPMPLVQCTVRAGLPHATATRRSGLSTAFPPLNKSMPYRSGSFREACSQRDALLIFGVFPEHCQDCVTFQSVPASHSSSEQQWKRGVHAAQGTSDFIPSQRDVSSVFAILSGSSLSCPTGTSTACAVLALLGIVTVTLVIELSIASVPDWVVLIVHSTSPASFVAEGLAERDCPCVGVAGLSSSRYRPTRPPRCRLPGYKVSNQCEVDD